MSYPQYTPPPKRRPGRIWFVVGAVLLLSAGVVFAVGLYTTINRASATDGTVRTNAGDVAVSAPADSRRTLFVIEGTSVPQCSVHDGAGPRELEDIGGRVVVTTGGREWHGFASFDSGDGDLRIQCVGPDGDVRVGASLGAGFVGSLLVTILGPIGLGIAGVAVLIMTGVLRGRRPAPPR